MSSSHTDTILNINEQALLKIWQSDNFNDQYNFTTQCIASPYSATNTRTKIIQDYIYRQIMLCKEIKLSAPKSLMFLAASQDLLFKCLFVDQSEMPSRTLAAAMTKEKVKELVQNGLNQGFIYTKEEISKILASLSELTIKNIALYQYIVTNNPREVVDTYVVEIETPLSPPPLRLSRDLNEPVADSISVTDSPSVKSGIKSTTSSNTHRSKKS